MSDETYTPWCPSPDDHCLNGDCVYGDHGPAPMWVEDLLRADGYEMEGGSND